MGLKEIGIRIIGNSLYQSLEFYFAEKNEREMAIDSLLKRLDLMTSSLESKKPEYGIREIDFARTVLDANMSLYYGRFKGYFEEKLKESNHRFDKPISLYASSVDEVS